MSLILIAQKMKPRWNTKGTTFSLENDSVVYKGGGSTHFSVCPRCRACEAEQASLSLRLLSLQLAAAAFLSPMLCCLVFHSPLTGEDQLPISDCHLLRTVCPILWFRLPSGTSSSCTCNKIQLRYGISFGMDLSPSTHSQWLQRYTTYHQAKGEDWENRCVNTRSFLKILSLCCHRKI